MEEELSSLDQVIQEANLTKAELQEHLEDMRVELQNLEQEHEQVHHQHLRDGPLTCDLLTCDLLPSQDVRVLYTQMGGREVDEPDAPVETSLDQILASIRSHWEKATEKNRAESDSYLDRQVSSHLAGVLASV